MTFSFTDSMGASHESSVEEYDEKKALAYQKPAAIVKIRYHPDHPEQFRWLD